MAERHISKRKPPPAPQDDGRFLSKLRTAKVVLLGSSGVGKSSIALRYIKDEFKSEVPTVGCAYLTQVVCMNSTRLKLELWDTAGQEIYHSVTPLYYRGACAALIVYDITRMETFMRAQLWLKELRNADHENKAVIALVGNKTDLAFNRQVSKEAGQIFAQKNGLIFMETSAKSGYHVEDIFLCVAQKILSLDMYRNDQQMMNASTVALQDISDHPPSKACCSS
ncbi:ras-related protein Rab-17-like [Protopterus annectens]|uniref:ras-related protein Rab-17-like n=1 Tax=Protopterus annectens TaxID=7888 RepID=UPI001CFA7AAC|nr:ras-related protein Rab-17-like [Protopterus annectens]